MIGMWEIITIGGIALVIIGPDKFPGFLKLVVRTSRDLRGYMDDVKRELNTELNPLKKEMDKLRRVDPEKYIDSLMGEEEEEPKAIEKKTSSYDDEEREEEYYDPGYDSYGYNPESEEQQADMSGGVDTEEAAGSEPAAAAPGEDAAQADAEPEIAPTPYEEQATAAGTEAEEEATPVTKSSEAPEADDTVPGSREEYDPERRD